MAGLAGQCFFISLSCSIRTILFYSFSLSLVSVYGLVLWGWGLRTDRVYITVSALHCRPFLIIIIIIIIICKPEVAKDNGYKPLCGQKTTWGYSTTPVCEDNIIIVTTFSNATEIAQFVTPTCSRPERAANNVDKDGVFNWPAVTSKAYGLSN